MTNDLDNAYALVREHGTIDLDLVGLDGNVFSIIGAVLRRARRADWPATAVSQLQTEMSSGNYDHALQVAMVATGDLDLPDAVEA